MVGMARVVLVALGELLVLVEDVVVELLPLLA